jgi:hypothetical protein
MTTSSTLEELAQQALEGDRDALDSLVRALQGDLYGLSLRMLSRPLHFARRSTSFAEARALVRQVDEARWSLEVHRSSQPRAASLDFAQRLLTAIDRSVGDGPPHS